MSAPPQTPSCAENLMEVMLERTNMWRAIKHVEANKGAAGMDHVTVADLRSYVQPIGQTSGSPSSRGPISRSRSDGSKFRSPAAESETWVFPPSSTD